MTALRVAVAADLPAINDVYNHHVATSTCAWTTQRPSMPERDAWFGAGCGSIVAEISSDQEASLALHHALGFAEAGRQLSVGHMFGDHRDLVYLQLLLQQSGEQA